MASQKNFSPKSVLLYFLSCLLVVNGVLLLLEGMSTPAETAAQVIAAEAADRGLVAMTAVGEVIRARGSFEGFSVMSKDLPAFFQAESSSTRFQCRLAWILSKLGLFSGGATHFENVRLFGRPAWAKGMTVRARWAGLEFYRKANTLEKYIGKVNI